MPTSGPTTRRSHPISGMGLQDAAIDAPEGDEELMSMTAVASMPPAMGCPCPSAVRGAMRPRPDDGGAAVRCIVGSGREWDG